MFAVIGIRLMDSRLEFGRVSNGDFARVILADEISPDGCRLWWTSRLERKKLEQGSLPAGPWRRQEAYRESLAPGRRPVAEEPRRVSGLPDFDQPSEEARQVILRRARVRHAASAALDLSNHPVPSGITVQSPGPSVRRLQCRDQGQLSASPRSNRLITNEVRNPPTPPGRRWRLDGPVPSLRR